MRASKLAFLAPLFVLTGCPQFLDDYTIGSADSGSLGDASSGGSSGSGGLAGLGGAPGTGGSFNGGATGSGGLASGGSSSGGSTSSTGGATASTGGTASGSCVVSTCPACTSPPFKCCNTSDQCACTSDPTGIYCPSTGTGGATSTGGSTGCTLVTHSNGMGQTWQDCVALATYDSAQATKACNAWCAANGCVCANPGSATNPCCFSASFCGVQYMAGQVGTSGSSVVLMGWSWTAPNAGNATSVDPVTQNSCTVVGTWN